MTRRALAVLLALGSWPALSRAQVEEPLGCSVNLAETDPHSFRMVLQLEAAPMPLPAYPATVAQKIRVDRTAYGKTHSLTKLSLSSYSDSGQTRCPNIYQHGAIVARPLDTIVARPAPEIGDFFSRHVRGAEHPPVNLYYKNLGIRLVEDRRGLPVRFELDPKATPEQLTRRDEWMGKSARRIAIVNARVWTGDARRRWADAVLTRGDRIAVIGSSAEVMKRVDSSTQVVDARGGFVCPGFIDSHVHFLAGGLGLSSVQLRDAATPQEFVRRIAEFAASRAAGVWIRNGDWDHELWGGGLPSRGWIDAGTGDRPVWINRLDGHMSLANGAALSAAGITRDTPDVAGGTIVRDATGEPTGILKDNAQTLIDRVAPAPTDSEIDAALRAAMAFVASHGVTSVHHMGTWEDLAVFERAHAANALATRIYAAVPIETWARLRDRVDAGGRGDEWLRIGALKGFVDGSLGSHTAAMLEPFTDALDDGGLFVNSADDLYRWTEAGDAAGLQMIVHAIGDRAIRTQLDIYERVAAEHGTRDRRFRIEHAQHLDAADVGRFASLDVIASVQPYHAIDDGRWAERVIGPERAKLTYAFRSLLDAGARLAFGSDWFVAPPTPLEGIYAAVTRRTLDGRYPGGWIPEQRIPVERALHSYTSDAAFASFEEGEKGTLERGKLADLVLIDRDITRIAPEEIREARVMMTVVGGRVVHAPSES